MNTIRPIKFGLIGAGNMGGTILKAAIYKGCVRACDAIVYDVAAAQTAKMAAEFPEITVAESNLQLAKQADCILVGVKPVFMNSVLREIAADVKGKAVISIAAGWSMDMLNQSLGEEHGAMLLRVMPNTPALVGEGYTALCEETTLSADWHEWAKKLFDCLGESAMVPERLFDSVIAVTGSSPAYIYTLIDAMALGGVQQGMPRAMAQRAAAQAVLGAAKMVLETGEHPCKLRDDVCSPAGTTIAAVDVLKNTGFESSIMAAMAAAAERNREMTGKKG